MAPLERFAVEPPLVWPGQSLSPGVPEAQGDSEAWFLDCRVPQKHFVFRDFEAVFGPFSRSTSGRRGAYRGDQGRCLAGLRWKGFSPSASALRVFESPSSAEPLSPHLDTEFLGSPPLKKSKKGEIRAFFSVGDFPIEANSSVVEGLCQSSKLAARMAALAPATYGI